MQKLNIYSADIMVFDILNLGGLNSDLLNIFHNKDTYDLCYKSTYNFWNEKTQKVVFLRKIFENCCKIYLKTNKHASFDVILSRCWVNLDYVENSYSQSKHYHIHNIHEGKNLVCIYYLFTEGEPNNNAIFKMTDFKTEYQLELKSGQLIIFPNWLHHKGECISSTKETPRISIACNARYNY